MTAGSFNDKEVYVRLYLYDFSMGKRPFAE